MSVANYVKYIKALSTSDTPFGDMSWLPTMAHQCDAFYIDNLHVEDDRVQR